MRPDRFTLRTIADLLAEARCSGSPAVMTFVATGILDWAAGSGITNTTIRRAA